MAPETVTWKDMAVCGQSYSLLALGTALDHPYTAAEGTEVQRLSISPRTDSY